MAGSLLCKLLQRKTYDVLAKKHTLLLLFVGFIILLVSAFRFGETLMEWSKEKYAVVFSPYSNNILGKSYRSMLCQYVPIDVVYTWVNGSDPEFVQALTKAKEDYGYISSKMNCSFSNCIKSHMVLLKPQLPNSMTLSDLEEVDPIFQHISNSFVVASEHRTVQNITILVFPSRETAEVVSAKKKITLDGQNFTLKPAFVTDNWGSLNTVSLNSMFLLTQLPAGFSEEQVIEKLPDDMKSSVSKVFIHEEKNVALLTLSNPNALDAFLKLNNITFENKIVPVSSAYLVIELPSEHEDISASRFTDNEELRYSLRSLEKHAPWVQHVYIITNGQIPYWLNLDNPLITIVTHEEIFPNKSHLPTFSSPAIECHLHRIPNLSQKFIYLNDDVMFGKDVWPEDFYTHTKGQKVYLSWPVPNCAEGCPSAWIRDGYCDKPCNNSQCQWDGGDCTADNPMLNFQAVGLQQERGVTTYFHLKTLKNYCNNECADTWLADRYCDKACNVLNCGFDAGDCGVGNFDHLHQFILSEEISDYYLPDGEYVAFFNLSQFLASNRSLTEGVYEESPVIRTIAVSLKHAIIGVVLYQNHNSTNITITLKGEIDGEPYQRNILLHVMTSPLPMSEQDIEPNFANSTLLELTEEPFTFEDFKDIVRYPKLFPTATSEVSSFEFGNVNVSASQLPENVSITIENLRKLQEEGVLTRKGFLKRKSELIAEYILMHNDSNEVALSLITEVPEINTESHPKPNSLVPSTAEKTALSTLLPSTVQSHQMNIFEPSPPKLADVKKVWDNLNKILDPQLLNPLNHRDKVQSVPGAGSYQFFPKGPSGKFASLKDYFLNVSALKKPSINVKSTYLTVSSTQRHLLDTFGNSLRHVNKLYNEAFGFETRKVPSHIAHFVDRNVMSRLTNRFENAFEITSSHKIRSSNDMQFAFSYYYYLMSEMETIEVMEIFDNFDTDRSGTWSDREIRTVLARLYDLPLAFSSVGEFEQLILNCSMNSAAPVEQLSTPQDERYFGSQLPLVTRSLILLCPSISNTLIQHFGSRKRNGFEILGEEEVAFKMIHNNLSQVLGQIDDLRKHPKKFVCLNDNMNHGSKEAEMIRAVIQDFYESLFPSRSQFELSPEYRNRFLYVRELKEWRRTRDIVRIVTYLTLLLLIVFSVVSFWKAEMRVGERYPRLRTIQHRNRNSQHV